MFTPCYLYAGGPPHTSKRTYPLEGFSMKTEDSRRAKRESSLLLEPILDLFDDLVELTKSIFRFLFCSFGRIGNELNFERSTVAFSLGDHFQLLAV
jgi:hypothetical protein